MRCLSTDVANATQMPQRGRAADDPNTHPGAQDGYYRMGDENDDSKNLMVNKC